MYEQFNIPIKNSADEAVGNATILYTGRIDALFTAEEGRKLHAMIKDGRVDSLTLKANLVEEHPLNIEAESLDGIQLRCPIPRIAPIGIEVTKQGLKDAWDSIVTPMQDEGKAQSMEWRTIMAVMRTVYGAMPDEE